jgi:hypothetical protein
MRRVLLSVAVVSLSLALAGGAGAADRKGSHTSKSSPGDYSYRTSFSNYQSSHGDNFYRSSFSNYHLTYGTPFAGGYFYKGKDHSHWSHTRWFEQYGCTCYWCPCTSRYYYWCQPDGCYYPVSHCPYGKYSW